MSSHFQGRGILLAVEFSTVTPNATGKWRKIYKLLLEIVSKLFFTYKNKTKYF